MRDIGSPFAGSSAPIRRSRGSRTREGAELGCFALFIPKSSGFRHLSSVDKWVPVAKGTRLRDGPILYLGPQTLIERGFLLRHTKREPPPASRR